MGRPRPDLRRPLVLIIALAVTTAWAGCDRHDPDAFSPTSPSFQEALSLSASPGSIPADGFSTSQLEARISSGAEADRRTVTLETTAGTILGASDAEKTTRMVTADAEGVARAQLRSSTQVETAEVTATVDQVDGLVQRITVEFTEADPSSVISLRVERTSGDADGVSRIPVFADVAPEIASDRREVTFKTSLGTFAQSGNAEAKATPDGSQRATVDLVSPAAVGRARLTATVNGFTSEASIDFGPAFPDAIVVTLSPLKLQHGGTETSAIMVQLSRRPGRGKVTDKLEMEYEAVDRATGSPLAFVFSNRTLSGNEQATASVSLSEETFTGVATIRAKAAGGDAEGEEDLEVLPPA